MANRNDEGIGILLPRIFRKWIFTVAPLSSIHLLPLGHYPYKTYILNMLIFLGYKCYHFQIAAVCKDFDWVFLFFMCVFVQIKFQPNDHGEIRELADEIKNFEGIRHESLVKYYGVELHRVRILSLSFESQESSAFKLPFEWL